MAEFSAKDVQALRKATGAGMMDAKRALVDNDGDAEAAARWLREKGLDKAAARSDRENVEGVVALAVDGDVAALVELKSETDFVAKSDDFTGLAHDIAEAVLTDGEEAVASKQAAIDDLRVRLKENIELGRVVRFEAAAGNVLDGYLHEQQGRGVNGVLVELAGGSGELAHDVALHVASSRPTYLSRDEVPADVVTAERSTLEAQTRNEGKPEQAVDKIVEGRLTAFYKQSVLLEQGFVKADKTSVADHVGDAEVVRFAQVEIGR